MQVFSNVAKKPWGKRLRKSDDLSAALFGAREAANDRAEQFLFEKCERGDTTALIFFLKTQGQFTDTMGLVERSTIFRTNSS